MLCHAKQGDMCQQHGSLCGCVLLKEQGDTFPACPSKEQCTPAVRACVRLQAYLQVFHTRRLASAKCINLRQELGFLVWVSSQFVHTARPVGSVFWLAGYSGGVPDMAGGP